MIYVTRGQYKILYRYEWERQLAKTVEKRDIPFWTDYPRADGRIEWLCPHGVGHGSHDHGCDGCCSRDDYPGKEKRDEQG